MKKYISLLTLTILFIGCDDFLDEDPEGFRTPLGFYETEAEIDQGVAGVYAQNRNLFYSPNQRAQLQLRFGEMRSDNTNIQNTGDGGGIEDDELNEFTMQADNGRISSYWNICYKGISNANFVIANIDGVEFGNPETKDMRLGEVLFLRTWLHFNLVQLFGDVPYVTQPGESPEQILSEDFLTRDPEQEVYSNILVDAQEAIDLLPLPADVASEDAGRATKGAALMLKAKILMALQQNDQARPLLEQIRSLGYYSLIPSYANVFIGQKNHKENIFEIQYDQSLGQFSNFFSNFVPTGSGNDILGEGSVPNGRGNQFQPTSDLIALYSDTDERKAHNISIYVNSDGIEFPWGSKFAAPFDRDNPGEQNINFPMFRYADALLMLAECYATDGGGDPIAIIQQIRARAGITGPLSSEELADINQTIADERRRELFLEGHRFFDLLRTNRLTDVMRAHGLQQISENQTITDGGYQNIRTRLGIPQGLILQFGMVQTPGWE